jgi:putative acyl-CoA dehydrogenase
MFGVANQPPPLEDYNLLSSDKVLREAVRREGAAHAQDELAALGATLGRRETIELGFAANRNPPVLKSFDRFGHRLDDVEFHPAWHALMTVACAAGLHSSPWAERAKPGAQSGAHVARAAGTYMLTQIESGVYCPVAMTYGSVPTLAQAPAIAAEWLPRITARAYDPRFVRPREKRSALLGMGMTENQGGSDLRTNTTRAEPAGDGSFRLHGHKWFMSAPMCDAFLVLAQSPKGLSCFLMPRFAPDGTRNAVHINRLKDKLGNKSNASSEVEFHGAMPNSWARRGAASRPSSRWAITPGSTAASVRPA